MIERPDVVDEDLEAWEPEPLGSGFAIEDALVREADWGDVRAAGGVIKRSRLEGVKFAGARMRSLRLVDCILADCDLSNADLGAAELNRVVFERCRMTGWARAGCRPRTSCCASARWSSRTSAARSCGACRSTDCELDDADFAGAVLREVRFEHSRLRRVLIDGLRLTRVDFRGSVLEPDGDIAALRGAIIDSLQLVELAPLLASGLGLTVRDG